MPAKISETKPTHEQAQLQLQLYEERRETRLREARDWSMWPTDLLRSGSTLSYYGAVSLFLIEAGLGW